MIHETENITYEASIKPRLLNLCEFFPSSGEIFLITKAEEGGVFLAMICGF